MARFDGGHITTDGGGLLLRETERMIGIIGQFATCFTDYRDPDRIEHTVDERVARRTYALALGCEDLNDHGDQGTAALSVCWPHVGHHPACQ